MSLSDHPKAYGTAALSVAFIAGIFVTLGFKDIYPDLERRYQNSRARNRRANANGTTSSSQEFRPLSTYLTPVQLEDHDRRHSIHPATITSPPIPSGIESLIGNTPLFRINSLSKATGFEILAKAEFLNGAGNSTKDRVALHMINMAESQGLLTPHQGDTIYEGTVGSTGISLATLARAKGYKAHICMPSDQSREKSDLLQKLGATVERVTPAPITDINHFVNLARRRAEEHSSDKSRSSKGFFADQFESQANYTAHILTTGPEIFNQTSGDLDFFVAGAGTGGTISGVSIYLKTEKGSLLPNLKVILADPEGSGLYNKVKHGVMFSETEKEGTRRRQQVDSIVEGVGINRLTRNFEVGWEAGGVDDVVRVKDVEAMRMARWLVERDGIFIGSSSAVNCVAAVRVALEMAKSDTIGEDGEPKQPRIVTLLCDSGTRHLSKFWKQIGDLGRIQRKDDTKAGGEATRDDLVEIFGEDWR